MYIPSNFPTKFPKPKQCVVFQYLHIKVQGNIVAVREGTLTNLNNQSFIKFSLLNISKTCLGTTHIPQNLYKVHL